MRKAKILFVTVDTTGGGAERMMFNIIGTLRPECEIRLLVTTDEPVPAEAPNNFTLRNLNKKHASSALWQIISEVHSFKPDYLFTTSSSIGYMLVLAKMTMPPKYKPKVFIRCAVPPSEVYSRSIKSKVLRYLISLTYRGADCIIAQTEFMRQDLIKSYKLPPSKVRHIRNIVDTKLLETKSCDFSPVEYSNSDFNIIAAGALYSVKGFDILIKAFEKSDYRRHNARLYIIGKERYEYGYENYLRGLIRELRLDDYVFLLGHKTNPYPYIKNADLLVMSSRKEGFPNVVLEALTLGTPVVATNCVDWSHVIECGRNGYVIPRNDVGALADAIGNAMELPLDIDIVKISNYDYNQLFK